MSQFFKYYSSFIITINNEYNSYFVVKATLIIKIYIYIYIYITTTLYLGV